LDEEDNTLKWAHETAVNRATVGTPISTVVDNFRKFRGVFLKYLQKFFENENNVSFTVYSKWNIKINALLDEIYVCLLLNIKILTIRILDPISKLFRN
jgi:hypothetical protein